MEPIEGVTISQAAIGPDSVPDAKDSFHLLVDGATEYAVFALSPDGLVSTWNQGAQRIKGYAPDEIVGRSFSVFYTEADRRSGLPEQNLRQALTTGRTVTEGWRVRRDGSTFWASVVVTPLWDSAGGLRGFAKLTRDDSDRRRAEDLHEELARLQEAERIAGRLNDTVISDLFAATLLLEGALASTTSPESRRRIHAAVDQMDATIKRIRQAVLGGGHTDDR